MMQTVNASLLRVTVQDMQTYLHHLEVLLTPSVPSMVTSVLPSVIPSVVETDIKKLHEKIDNQQSLLSIMIQRLQVLEESQTLLMEMQNMYQSMIPIPKSRRASISSPLMCSVPHGTPNYPEPISMSKLSERLSSISQLSEQLSTVFTKEEPENKTCLFGNELPFAEQEHVEVVQEEPVQEVVQEEEEVVQEEEPVQEEEEPVQEEEEPVQEPVQEEEEPVQEVVQEEEPVQEEEELVQEEEEVDEVEEVEEEEVEEEEVTVEEITYLGETYYKDDDNFIYKPDDDTPIGYWKEKTKTIAFYKTKI